MVLDVTADPSLMRLRSGFGRQVTSVNENTAAFGFGTAGRDSYSKVRDTITDEPGCDPSRAIA